MSKVNSEYEQETIMVVPAPVSRSFGVVPINENNREEVLEYISSVAVSKVRDEVEDDDNFLQLIPYVVVGTLEGDGLHTVLGARRLKGSGESRLRGGITIGFGGHVQWNDPDQPVVDVIQDSIDRELYEELGVSYESDEPLPLIGLIYNDTDDVGRVHLGLVYFLDVTGVAERNEIVSQEPDKLETMWITYKLIDLLDDQMEMWARMTKRFLDSIV